MGKPWIYIASPYTRGDVALNVRTQMLAFDRLIDMGVVPIAPLLSHFQHLLSPRPYQTWIDHDLELIQRCDACLRLDAEHEFAPGDVYRETQSPGADNEVAEFNRLGRPVFRSFDDLAIWLAAQEATA